VKGNNSRSIRFSLGLSPARVTSYDRDKIENEETSRRDRSPVQQQEQAPRQAFAEYTVRGKVSHGDGLTVAHGVEDFPAKKAGEVMPPLL
jgi:hypothetical protein